MFHGYVNYQRKDKDWDIRYLTLVSKFEGHRFLFDPASFTGIYILVLRCPTILVGSLLTKAVELVHGFK